MIPARGTSTNTVLKIRDGQAQRRRDRVILEEPLALQLQFEVEGVPVQKEVTLTMRTPGADVELAAGFLLAEGIVEKAADMTHFTYCLGSNRDQQQYNLLQVQLRPGLVFDPSTLLRHFATHASCGICGKATVEALWEMGQDSLPPSTHHPTPEQLQRMPDILHQAQTLFHKTGGVHAAALFSSEDGSLLSWQEDIGRHNAVDKLIGEQLLAHRLPLLETVMLVSGRVSFEIMQKALRGGVPIVAAIGAPSSLAVEVGQEFGMTLLGFVRKDGFNVYCGAERLTLPK